MTRDDKFKLSWFPFYTEDYMRDTLHLDATGSGAYLFLLVSYYGTGRAPLDNDAGLRNICRLSAEDWQIYRPLLADLFQIRDGRWYHKRVEAELDKAYSLHTASIAHAKTAAEARWGKKSPEHSTGNARAMPKASPKHKLVPAASSENAQGNAQGVPGESTLTITSTKKERERDARAQGSIEDSKKEGQNSVVGNYPKRAGEDIGTTIDRGFRPEPDRLARCAEDGASAETIETEIEQFIAYHRDKGTWSADWDGAWLRWWQRWRERTAKAAPRIEVNSGPSRAAVGYKPSEAEFDRAAMLFAKNSSHWSSQMGPEPGMSGCKCPPEILTKHGIDPKTGLKIRAVG